jgi:RNA polymerase sigma factor (sigma-70 family)
MERPVSLGGTDREIIEQLVKGGVERRKSEERLFTRFSYFIREGMRQHGLPEEDIFSAYSDTILTAIDQILSSNFEGRSSLKTYLYQIFHHKCVDLIRKKTSNKNSVNRSETLSDSLQRLSDAAKSVLQQLIEKADWNLLRERMTRLDDKCRQMLLLWGDNYSDREIAAALSYKSPDVVKTSRVRCMEKLRRMYYPT